MISIIVPIYNTEESLLRRCVASILDQSYKDIELLLINDGSKEQTKNVLDKIAEIDSRVNVLHKENGGVSSARNYGLSIAKGEYICFVDADDYLADNYFASAIKEIEKVDLVVGKVNWSREDAVSRTNYEAKSEKGKVDYYNVKGNEAQIVSRFMDWEDSEATFNKGFEPEVWGKLYRKSILASQKFDENLAIGEDVLFFMEYLMKCSEIAIVNEIYYNYMLNDDSAMHSMDPARADKYLKFMNKTIEVYNSYSLSESLPRKLYYSTKELSSFCTGGKIAIKEYYDYAVAAVNKIYSDETIREYLKSIKYTKGMDRIGVMLLQHGYNGYQYELFKKRIRIKIVLFIKKFINR